MINDITMCQSTDCPLSVKCLPKIAVKPLPLGMGSMSNWSLDNNLMSIILWVFEEDVFYQVDDYTNAKRTTQIPFNLGEFVKLFEV
jgi:hypothetical protein